MNVADYYSSIAKKYDEDRFGNSYGQFLHRRETSILRRFLLKAFSKNGSKKSPRILDLGCGTGRFSAFSTDGLDQSAEMIEIARGKCPDCRFSVGDARQLPFGDGVFEAIFCLHLVMHLPEKEVAALVAEARRTLRTGGFLVLDFPSRKRRKLLGQHPSGWHGATAFDLQNFVNLIGAGWAIRRTEGALMLPIQRIWPFFRPFLASLDAFLGKSGLREWSSYIFVLLEKKA